MFLPRGHSPASSGRANLIDRTLLQFPDTLNLMLSPWSFGPEIPLLWQISGGVRRHSPGDVGSVSKQIPSTWFAAKLQASVISFACCCIADEAEFTYPPAWTNRLCKAGPALRCCWSYRCTLAPILFPHLCEKHWHAATFNPFQKKNSFFYSYTAAPGIWKIIINLWWKQNFILKMDPCSENVQVVV